MDNNQHEPQFRPMPPTLQLPTTTASTDGSELTASMFTNTSSDVVMAAEKNVSCDSQIFRGPIICEQGPSGPSSPTVSPRSRRPSPLTPEAMRRINLLTTESHDYDPSKLSPLSPNYPTSDLGSSPRSSIGTVVTTTSSGIGRCSSGNLSGGGAWCQFRDQRGSDGSDGCSKDLLSPGMMLSPAPFSPFSDEPGTPYSQTGSGASPNLSPMLGGKRALHFSFDQIKPSLSSVSLQIPPSHTHNHFLAVPSQLLPRERSRSDSDMGGRRMEGELVSDRTHIGVCGGGGQFKKRLLQKYEAEQERTQCGREHDKKMDISENEAHEEPTSSIPRLVAADLPMASPFSGSVIRDAIPSSAVFNMWVQKQLMAWQSAAVSRADPLPPIAVGRSTSLRLPSSSSSSIVAQPHLRQPVIVPSLAFHRPMMQLAGPSSAHVPRLPYKCVVAPGPIKMWRRSRSESDVSGNYVCQHCNQAFALHDRLAKHIASRHRDRSASIADDDAKIHKCTMCHKSFGRSDMLTRHMRLHTGTRPYGCHICGQVFSRSDHLSTHQRTHTGEKPYQCPQCSYAASRRDMITRHMRTHNRSVSGVDELGPAQAPMMVGLPIATLSLDTRDPGQYHRPAIPTTIPLPSVASSSASATTTGSSPQQQKKLAVAQQLLRLAAGGVDRVAESGPPIISRLAAGIASAAAKAQLPPSEP